MHCQLNLLIVAVDVRAELSLDSKNHGADRSNVISYIPVAITCKPAWVYSNSLTVWIEGYSAKQHATNDQS